MRKFILGVVVGWYLSDVIDEALEMARVKLKDASDTTDNIATGDAIGNNVTNVFTNAPERSSAENEELQRLIEEIREADPSRPVEVTLTQMGALYALDKEIYSEYLSSGTIILAL